MADSAVAATTKKKNRPPRKKKNEASKNNGPKNAAKMPAEPNTGKGGGFANDKVETKATQNSKSNATPERGNAKWEESRQHNVQKKKNFNSPSVKKVNSPKIGDNSQSRPSPVTRESDRRIDYQDRNHCDGDEYNNLVRVEMRQIEEKRKWKWHHYFLSNPNDLIRLDRNQVVLLRTIRRNRERAQFICNVCKYYCDDMSVVGSHIRSLTHLRQLKDYNYEMTIREVPEMTKDQMSSLNEFLKSQVQSYSMDPINLETRRTIGVLVSELVSTNLPGCTTRLFGSSIHGLGLKTADVNIDLQVPEGSLPPEMLKEVANLLGKSAHFIDVVENFHCEFPFISFKYKKSGENCSLSLNNERAVSLALLLSKYTPLDPRLTQLATLFRLWGQITQTDKAQDGTWPGYAFYLLTIFYLQQCKDPVLPVLNDFLPNNKESEENNTAKVLSLDIGDIKSKWQTANKLTLAELWLGLLSFYAVGFQYTDFMVCIDSSALKPRKTRKLFIVDPFLPTRNVARSISSNAAFDYIMSCLMITCRYYCIPQTKFGPLFGDIITPYIQYSDEHVAILETHERINTHLIQLIMKLDNSFQVQQSREDIQQSISEAMRMMQKHDFQNVDNIPISHITQNSVPPRHLYGKMNVSPEDAQMLMSSFSAKFVEYSLVPHFFTGGQPVPKICNVCKCDGHRSDECPEEKLPPLFPIPENMAAGMHTIDQLCYYVFDKWKQSDEDIQKREDICQQLQEFIGAELPTARLELFGSTKNGFGLKGSDMDICLSFEDNKTGEGLDTRGFIEILYRLLKTFKELQDLLPIATAKVPIVKFTHKATKLDGDISLYNVLALENSKLLCTYATIDKRARVLGYMMKRFSKVCHIGDASKGSLSSYAYTLMVIYFLQRCHPPVLPVLQELTENGEPPPKHIVEGCNAYFFSDLSKLDTVWDGHNKNKQSVGELWFDLLVFYTEQFDMLNNVICIRCSRSVTKFEKLWISKGIAIEDPFDLSHNLGSALTRKMSLYIIKSLRLGRNLYAKVPPGRCKNPKDLENFFLNGKLLTVGDPPNDRGCRVCKSIGHKERECPQKKKKKGRKGGRNQNKSQNETPTKKSSVSEDEDDAPYLSDSDNGSSDQEDKKRPMEVPKKAKQALFNQNIGTSSNDGVVYQPPKPSPKKSVEQPNVGFKNKNSNGGGVSQPPKPSSKNNIEQSNLGFKHKNSNGGGVSQPHKPSPMKNMEQPNVGFKQTGQPLFMVQDPNHVSGSASSSFSAHSNTPISIPRNRNSQPPPMKLNISASPTTPKSDLGIPPQKQDSTNNNPALIPTIIFSNSKLSSDSIPPKQYPPLQPIPSINPISPISINPLRYPPFTEQNPPPGFVSNHQHRQFGAFSPSNPEEGDDRPLFLRIQYPMFRPIFPTGVAARPPVIPFNNHQVLGMLGPTEQQVWGHVPPTSSPDPPPPFAASQPPSFDPHACEAVFTKMKINSDVSTVLQNNLSQKDSNVDPTQSKTNPLFPPPNTTILNNMT